MSIDRGEPDEFEIIWKSGAVERFKADQVTWPNALGHGDLFIRFMGEFDGEWRLLLQARECDLVSVRNLTQVGEVR